MPRGNPSRARGRQRRNRRQEAGDRKPARVFRSPAVSPRPLKTARPARVHNGHPRLRFDPRAVVAVIHLLDAHAGAILGCSPRNPCLSIAGGVSPGELSLAFLTDAALARLHAEFLGNRSPTDVITFAATPALGQAGEICVSADAARTFAQRHGRDFSAELTLYLVHGWLHLTGHDDLQPAGKRRMRAAEVRAMALLRAARAVPRFRWA